MARDKFHDAVKNALLKDGWTVTDEEFRVLFDDTDGYVDIMAEKQLIAEKGDRKIAVEVKTFAGKSMMSDLQKALGQFLIYQASFSISDPQREVILAVPEEAGTLFQRPLATKLRKKLGLTVLVYEPNREEIIEWIN